MKILVFLSWLLIAPLAMADNQSPLVFGIQQGGKNVALVNGVFTLKKASFDFVFEFPKESFLLLNASKDSRASEKIKLGVNPLDTRAFLHLPGAAYPRNRDRDLYVYRYGPQGFFYNDQENHRCNEDGVREEGGIVSCRVSIDKLGIIDDENMGRIEVELEKSTVNTLHLIFVLEIKNETTDVATAKLVFK